MSQESIIDALSRVQNYGNQIETVPRKLQVSNKNRNCDFTGEISCVVKSDQSDCADIYVRKDLCNVVPIRMNYTYCNEETDPANQIILLPSLTFAELYETDRITLDTTPLQPGTCRSVFQDGLVDTCVRKRINADMKLEGWKIFRRNYGAYCHIYRHYFPKVTTWTLNPTPAPTSEPTIAPTFSDPDFQVIAECNLEAGQNTGNFSVPCSELDMDYFIQSRRRRSTGGGTDFVRSIKYEFAISSQAGEIITADEITVTLDNTTNTIVENSNPIAVGPGETKDIANLQASVDFAKYSGADFEVEYYVQVTGQGSGKTDIQTFKTGFAVP